MKLKIYNYELCLLSIAAFARDYLLYFKKKITIANNTGLLGLKAGTPRVFGLHATGSAKNMMLVILACFFFVSFFIAILIIIIIIIFFFLLCVLV